MQLFLPYADLNKTAGSLDDKRLGNQCYRECKTLINGGWSNHPASKMIKGYEHFVARYAYALANEMATRRKLDGSPKWKPEVVDRWRHFWLAEMQKHDNTGNPPWLGNQEFHISHQSNLIRKDKNYYGPQFPNVPDNLEYIWPVKK